MGYGVFNLNTALGLSYIMYFYNNKLFGFRARDEHVTLMAEQYAIKVDPDTEKKFLKGLTSRSLGN